MNVDGLIRTATLPRQYGFTGTHKAVLLALVTECDHAGQCEMTFSEIAEEAWVNPATARNAVRTLCRRNVVTDLGLLPKSNNRRLYRLDFVVREGGE